MIEHFSKWLSAWLSHNGGDPTQEKVYAYGIECLANELISDFLLLFCGFLMNKTIYIVIWCMSFTAVRLFLGGYHASTHARCILTGTAAGICSLSINPIWPTLYPWGFLVITVFALAIAFFHAPIIHKNHPVSNEKRKKAKEKAIAAIILDNFTAIIVYPYHHEISSSIMTGLLTALLMAVLAIVICKFKNQAEYITVHKNL